MDQRILISSSAQGLNVKIQEAIKEGWTPVGGHSAVLVHLQNRYAGSQHMVGEYRSEYTQSMRKND